MPLLLYILKFLAILRVGDLLYHAVYAASEGPDVTCKCLQGYKPPDEPASEYQTIPLNKIEDFGVHCKQYYSLDITFFKSSLDAHLLDLLWNKYWVNTLSSSPLVTTRDLTAGQYADIGAPCNQQ